IEKIRVRTISRSPKAPAESEIRARNAHESRRSRTRTITKARLADCRSTSGGADAQKISALSGERARRIHCDQRRRCELENRVVERPGGGISGDRSTRHYRGQWCGKIFAAR